MENALLIGNGLNRCYEGTVSWSDLLKNIANEYKVRFNENNSFSLEFESIINQILYKKKEPDNTIYKEVKQKIAYEVTLSKPERKSLHELFVKDIGIYHILTTNYDYMMEFVLDSDYSKDKYPSKPNETKYSKYRKKKVCQTNFYHIHGEANYPTTLCLGYEHYVGYLAKMRKKTKEILGNLQNNYQFVMEEPETWLSLFFTHNVYIVGFSLDFCEIDLWWLLTYRAYLYYSNTNNMKKIIKNKIKIYIIDNPENNAEKMKAELLKNLHVECDIIEMERDYLSAYKQIADRIKSEMNKN